MRVTKSQLISETIDEVCEHSQKKVKRLFFTEYLDIFLAKVFEKISLGNEVFLRGFGAFSIREMKERSVILKGKRLLLPKKKKIYFRPSVVLKSRINAEDKV